MLNLTRINIRHAVDADGNPAGGTARIDHFDGPYEPPYLLVNWQGGPLGRHADGCQPDGSRCVDGCTRKEPNGAFVEDVLYVALTRLEFYQLASGGKFACDENAEAIRYLRAAMNTLERRTTRRERAGVEGTHEGDA